MSIMIALMFGSLLFGCSGLSRHRHQTVLALVAATIGTIAYFVSQRMM